MGSMEAETVKGHPKGFPKLSPEDSIYAGVQWNIRHIEGFFFPSVFSTSVAMYRKTYIFPPFALQL